MMQGIARNAAKAIISSTKAEPRSKKMIEKEVFKMREKCGISDSLTKETDVISLLDLISLMYNYDYQIVEDKELPELVYAETHLIEKKIYIKESVFNRAIEGVPRDRFTIAHEIGHVILHTNKIIVCRTTEEIKKYEHPEWQANCFAAELLVPVSSIKHLSIDQIMNKYNVSRDVALFRKKDSLI